MTTAKTALHTSNECDMYAHVSPYDMTGDWEWIGKLSPASIHVFIMFFRTTKRYRTNTVVTTQMEYLIHLLDSLAMT